MAESKHTPGPWVAHHQSPEFMCADSDCDWSLQSDAAGAFLLFCHHPDAPSKANARLIAAAPDLLEALQAARSILDEQISPNACAMADAAISRATGGAS